MNTEHDFSFLWFDYETFGIDPKSDRIAQFAAVRTDADLNEIGQPIELFCQPALDYLPSAQSCLVTHITPQMCQQRGVREDNFAAQVVAQFAQPGTCGVGYNSIRFDDEFTRHLLWRNLRDPYAREWQNGCSRWDVLDVVRMMHALRPQGMVWPVRSDGSGLPSFKLEHLSAANGIRHEAAHDALSDVRAMLALMRLVKSTAPRLFAFALTLREKKSVLKEMGLGAGKQPVWGGEKPFLHVSGQLPRQHGHMAVMFALAAHPSNPNEIICWDLRHDPSVLQGLSAQDIQQRLFITDEAARASDIERLPLKTIHINRSPMVIGQLKTLSPERAAELHIDIAQSLAHAEVARALLPQVQASLSAAFTKDWPAAADVDGALYDGGLLSGADRAALEHWRSLSPVQRAAAALPPFDDARLAELAWRWQARNWPETLSESEQQRWSAHCTARLIEGVGGARTAERLFAEIDQLGEQLSEDDEAGQEVLGELYDWASAIVPEA